MKKRIICSILAAVMLFGMMPLTVLAGGVAAISDAISVAADQTPTVSVSSLYYYVDEDYSLQYRYRALPDSNGTFYFDIALDKAPEVDEDIVVYYRTVDHTAVSKWGDYEAVGTNGDTYVILNKANGYKARVTVKSVVLDDAFLGPGLYNPDSFDESAVSKDEIFSRCFYFDLIRVEGNAKLFEPASSDEVDMSILTCYLRGERYHHQSTASTPSFYTLNIYDSIINTPEKHGVTTGNLNVSFSERWKNLMDMGHYYVGISLFGDCYEDWWNSDDDAILNIYYEYQGVKKKALTLNMEGEWDDNTFFGWELAYEYVNGNRTDSDGIDVEDYMKDNFRGFVLYDNDENVVYEVSGGTNTMVSQLKQALTEGYAIESDGAAWKVDTKYDDEVEDLHYLKLPSNFAYADSYSYEFISDSSGDPRWLEDVTVCFMLFSNEPPRIAETPDGTQMITTNANELMEGDLFKMTVRYTQPMKDTLIAGESCHMTAMLNGVYPLTLIPVNQVACDTWVYAAELPEEAKNVRLTSLKDIVFTQSHKTSVFRSFATNLDMDYEWTDHGDGWTKSAVIGDLYGFDCDLRTPVATVDSKETSMWVKSKPLDISVSPFGTGAAFNDYVMIYYEWSDSKELPDKYNSRLTMFTAETGEILKTIIGTGNGKTYLHMKAVSRYGKESISDKVTKSYDPSDNEAVYTPFGPYYFDNTAPSLSADDIAAVGSLKNQELSIKMPYDSGVGFDYMSLYYLPEGESTEGTLLKKFTSADFVGDPLTVVYEISHDKVGVGVSETGEAERRSVDFYFVISDKLGNVSGKTAYFSLVFDTNDYLYDEIVEVKPYDLSEETGFAQFYDSTEQVDELTFIYDYSLNNGKSFLFSGKMLYYSFAFKIDESKFGEIDNGSYEAVVKSNGETVSTEIVNKESGVYAVSFLTPPASGRYDIQLKRTEGESTRVSQIYTVYITDNESDSTAVKNKIESGTLLNNNIYQIPSDFYYKDKEGSVQHTYYNNTKEPASFSSITKAKEYVYFKELSDLYLVKLNAEIAAVLNSGTAGYLMARGETVVAAEGQYWIRYKSEAWTPNAGESSWVYYYYGMDGKLSVGSLSVNLQSALNAVANRIVSSGKSVILTDTSLFLGTVSGNKMLNEFGMPYLLDAQIHNEGETMEKTLCENVWETFPSFTADKNIYKSNIYVGEAGGASYKEYPIVGYFTVPATSRFQYMTYEAFTNGGTKTWNDLGLRGGDALVHAFNTSGVYYIREMSVDGVSVYPIYIDKEAPKVSFSRTDGNGVLEQIPVDGVEILDIRAREIIIGAISSAEYDRLSYVAVYLVRDLSLVGIYTADELDGGPVKLEDGNYYIVVSDRSGNHYTVTAKVSATDLECNFKESPNKFVKLTCNRKKDQILRYEVYLNGELVTSEYAQENSFESAGLYTVFIQDIYGNVFSEEYLFERIYPEVTWKYLGADGQYHVYDPDKSEDTGFVMSLVSENKFKISTSVKTRFTFSGKYTYEFIGTEPKHTETIGAETVVTIEAGQSFTLKVYYTDHPDNYVTYSGTVDVTPPTINVTADIDIPRNGEIALVEQWLENGKVGDVIKLEDLYYVVTEKDRRTVMNGATISSDMIKLNVSDANDISSVKVYLDGKLIRNQDAETGFSQIVLSRWGSYCIVARDGLGNVAEFTFVNGRPDYFDYSVDGNKILPDMHGYQNFEIVQGKHVYQNVDYGNGVVTLDINENADVFLSVGVSGSDTEIYGLRIRNGVIYSLVYRIVYDENEGEGDSVITVALEEGAAIVSHSSAGFAYGKEYRINADAADKHAVYASFSEDKSVSIRIYASDIANETVSVSARLEFGGSDIFFISSSVSGKLPTVSFKGENGNALIPDADRSIRTGAGFTVDSSLFESELIESVRLYYSAVNDLDPDSIDGRTDIYAAGASYDDEGFYILLVRNRFGNEAVYHIGISRGFGVTSSVEFADGHKIFYSKDYSKELYSNSRITLDIPDTEAAYTVTRCGVAYGDFSVKTEGGIKYLIFDEDGSYEVKIIDSYGNTVTKRLEIDRTPYSLSDGLLTGFNEKALKRNEGYTNLKLSVNKSVYDSQGLCYLAIGYKGSVSVLFDSFSEVPVYTDDSKLSEVIGNMGDGIYTVTVRNRYGTVTTREIHYRGTPTLTLERMTRSDSKPQVYDLNHALLHGFWSNNTLSFKTDAKTYVFTVNGGVIECPRTLSFDTTGAMGSTEYDITYIDEYGFEYNFKAYLVRKSVTVDIPTDVTGVVINGILNTRENVAVTFGENTYATCTKNNGEPFDYRSGDALKQDGTYRFTVSDYAGNATVVTVKKDTAVEFSFVETNTEQVLVSGGVANTPKVTLQILNKDTVEITAVLHNGVALESYTDMKFTEDGKWEILMRDGIGNEAYFCFYIITRAKDGFGYTTPYEYKITEMWYDGGEGIRVSYLQFVNHGESDSSFNVTENGTYTVVMVSEVTGKASEFTFTVDKNPPTATLVGCEVGEKTINDVTLEGCNVGDVITVYRRTRMGEEIVERVKVTSSQTAMPVISEGGEYRIVVESEAGVSIELSFIRKQVMNTSGSVFVMVVIGIAVAALFAGQVYRNKSKTDE